MSADPPIDSPQLPPGLAGKLSEMDRRLTELEKLLADPEVLAKPALYRAYVKEHGYLAKTVPDYRRLRALDDEIISTRSLLTGEADPDMLTLAEEELARLTEERGRLVRDIQERFLTEDADADRNVIVEIRAGTGGDEAALFAGDLFGMYRHYAENHGWKVEVMESSPTDLGGFKEIIFSVSGQDVYAHPRYESGVHRVQRVPRTETSGRIHTSAATVAVLPEANQVEIVIKDSDIEIDRMRSSGPGGQSVNKTSSAIRIHHLPTGVIVQCQDNKSQFKNLDQAMRILRSRLYDLKMNEDLAKILKTEGYIVDFKLIENRKQGILRVFLKYGPDRTRVIAGLRRRSAADHRRQGEACQ